MDLGIKKVQRAATKYGLLALVFVVSFVYLYFTTTNQFLLYFSKQMALMGLMVAGASVMMIGGDLDFSAAAQVAMASIVFARLANTRLPLWVVFVLVLLFGALVGGVKGILISALQVPSLVVTIGIYAIVSGLFTYIEESGDNTISRPLPAPYGTRYLLLLHMAYLLSLVLVYLFLQHSVMGKLCVALGENPSVVCASGTSTTYVRVSVHIFASLFISLCGVLLAVEAKGGSAKMASTYLFSAITAMSLGRVSILGGKGSVFGIAAGTAGSVALNMLLMRTAYSGQLLPVLQGVIILGVLGLDAWEKKRKSAD